jgi:hypothetical protein
MFNRLCLTFLPLCCLTRSRLLTPPLVPTAPQEDIDHPSSPISEEIKPPWSPLEEEEQPTSLTSEDHQIYAEVDDRRGVVKHTSPEEQEEINRLKQDAFRALSLQLEEQIMEDVITDKEAIQEETGTGADTC